MTVHFTQTTLVPASVQQTFDASLSVDVHLESLAHTGEEIVSGVEGGIMADGDTVTWRARHFGIWWHMTSIISEYDPPTFFVDQQHQGPFTAFRHEHHFEPEGEGTRMRDVVEFTAPFGPLGVVAEKVVLARYMKQLIATRNRALVSHLERSG
ncbi:SRPBCC family protein [Euzebya tangerina]|uniref:SRPBCC family protein n=1 Tax=Euzebya tangerina TaxID=591198 RepID=UPI000E317A48|nr:SRPBCC family protein [Euzebya tangerina]